MINKILVGEREKHPTNVSLTNDKTDSVTKKSISANEGIFSCDGESEEDDSNGPLVISYKEKEIKTNLNRVDMNLDAKIQEVFEEASQSKKVKREQHFLPKPNNFLYRVDEETGREDSEITENELINKSSDANHPNELSYSINNSEERTKPFKHSPMIENGSNGYIDKSMKSPLLGSN